MSPKTLRLVTIESPFGGRDYAIDHAGSDLESTIVDLFGSAIVPTPFSTLSDSPAAVISRLMAIPANAGYEIIETHAPALCSYESGCQACS